MSRSIRLIQSIGLALSRRQAPPAAAPPAPVVASDDGDPWAERSVTVRAVRRLARGTRPPTRDDSRED